jgi:predicted enzyme related to lactoylglutathione lyase
MMTGAHVVLYSTDAEADCAFLRDVLGWRWVDAGEGWLIFQLPPAEVAVHPTDGLARHELYLMCEDLETTLADLAARGVPIAGPPTELRWGLRAIITLPSGAELPLYQPRHPTAHRPEH